MIIPAFAAFALARLSAKRDMGIRDASELFGPAHVPERMDDALPYRSFYFLGA